MPVPAQLCHDIEQVHLGVPTSGSSLTCTRAPRSFLAGCLPSTMALAFWPVQVACGSYHTLFLQRGGRLLACGHAEYGQLGTMEVL